MLLCALIQSHLTSAIVSTPAAKVLGEHLQHRLHHRYPTHRSYLLQRKDLSQVEGDQV